MVRPECDLNLNLRFYLWVRNRLRLSGSSYLKFSVQKCRTTQTRTELRPKNISDSDLIRIEPEIQNSGFCLAPNMVEFQKFDVYGN